jgi:CBS domain-containing protein
VAFELHLNSDTVQRAYPFRPVCVTETTPVFEAMAQMGAGTAGCVLVCEDQQRLVGIFTERDVLRLMAAGADLEQPVGQVMSRSPVTVSITDSVGTAVRIMSVGGYRRLPVIDGNGCPAGILSVASILHYLVEHFPEFVYNLPPQPGRAMQQREGA